MKRTVLMLSIICLSAISIQAFAGPITLVKAKKFIKETNKLVFKARDEIKIHKVYNGDFTKSVIHQRQAVKLFKDQKYTKALQHSYCARFFANKTINANTDGSKKFIKTLSAIERSIVIDDTNSGFFRPNPAGDGTTENLNQDFVNTAIEYTRRPELDHLLLQTNKDKEFSNSPLNIKIQ